DGDGVPDMMVGQHNNPHPGQAFVYSGATGAILYDFVGNTNNDFYGHAVATPGDADLDGVPDLLIGAERDDANGQNAGRASLRSGRSGAILHDWKGDSPGDFLGSDISAAGDWDGDGVPDGVIGIAGDDPNGAGSGSARFVSGADGSVLL